MNDWELIVDSTPLPGSLNMAVDEYLFRRLGSAPQTCLRFYRWERPTISLGYSQEVEKAVNLDFCRRHGVPLVRRMTGGKLVLHHHEVTYSVCSTDVSIFSPSLRESYRLISCALIRGLAEMGLSARLATQPPPSYRRDNLLCFSHPAQNEVEINGRKVIGSAQKRVGTRFIQHGSVLLENGEALLRRVAAPSAELAGLRLISLAEALGTKVDFDWAVARLRRGFEEYFGIQFKRRVLTAEEWAIVKDIERTKYATEDWTLRHRPPELIDFFSSQ